MKLNLIVDLEMWGFGIIIFKNSEICPHKYSLDIQILCFDIWITFLKNTIITNEVEKQCNLPLINGLRLNTRYTFRCQDEEKNIKAIDIEFVMNHETRVNFPEIKIFKQYY